MADLESSRNWADLPGEIADLISKKLPPDRIYVVTFRAVCKSWRSAVRLSDPAPQLPWLIECTYFNCYSYLEQNLRFYSLAGCDTGTISVPEPYRGMVYEGPGHGYLFVSSRGGDRRCLLNPLTGDSVTLPELTDPEFRVHYPVCNGSDMVQNWHLSISLGHTDHEPGTYAIYHANSNDWTYVETEFDKYFGKTCCYDGKLFATESENCTSVYDVVSGEKLYDVPKLEGENPYSTTYLVESCGEILRVSLYAVIDKTDKVEVSACDVHKLCNSEGEGRHSWVKISDIGDQILFLDLNTGFSVRAPPGFRGNCTYFLLEDGDSPCRYDIGTGTLDMLPCPFTNCTWFIPHLG